ncbi:hypothetical protein F8M41_024503 [Gigaspora margarita]|uniref:Uncharacterized protein n=1 Tax=Gigaspora margarita TaxID=4874 RepID=A0A8H3XL10_GIGMA|nr:hypothetical protein F8M41_024503 [Gigaspora margarita]
MSSLVISTFAISVVLDLAIVVVTLALSSLVFLDLAISLFLSISRVEVHGSDFGFVAIGVLRFGHLVVLEYE